MAIDHTNCTHPRTAAGRRVCRGTRMQAAEMDAKGLVTMPVYPDPKAPARNRRMADAQRRLEQFGGRDAGPLRDTRARLQQEFPRIQPKKAGARVRADRSGCVQAALHTGRGKCACGWEVA